ncbi:MAG: hypothetical protein BRC42_01380, partial [Cyanobacteria bacterium QS_1_48_34]
MNGSLEWKSAGAELPATETCIMKQTHTNAIKLLERFIDDYPSGKDLKRALAVKLVLEGYTDREIQTILNVSLGLISKW